MCVHVCVCCRGGGRCRQWGYNTSVKIFEILKKVGKLSSHSLGFSLLPKHVVVPASYCLVPDTKDRKTLLHFLIDLGDLERKS